MVNSNSLSIFGEFNIILSDPKIGRIPDSNILSKEAIPTFKVAFALGQTHKLTGDSFEVKMAIRKILKIADGIAPSGFGEIKTEVAELITEECRKKNKISSIHVAESEEVQISSIEKYGESEVKRAINCNFNQIVHGTNLKGDDLKLIKESLSNQDHHHRSCHHGQG